MSSQEPRLTEMSKPAEWVTVDTKEVALRYNEGKPELSFILDAPLAMKGLAERFALGARKYPRHNWKKGFQQESLIDSLLRHLLAFQNGEVYDEDGGLHVDAIVWNSVVLSEQHHKMLNESKVNNIGN